MKRFLGVIIVMSFLFIGSTISFGEHSVEKLNGFSEGFAAAGVWEGFWHYGYVDGDGEWMIEPTFVKADKFSDGVAAVSVKDETTKIVKSGYVRIDGRYLVEPKYDMIKPFKNNHGVVIDYVDDAQIFGLVNETGELVVPVKYENISISSWHQIAEIRQNGKYGFYDIENKRIIEPKYDSIIESDEVVLLRNGTIENSRVGVYFMNSGKIIEAKYTSVMPMTRKTYGSYGINFQVALVTYLVEKDGKFGVLDKDGEIILQPIYDKIEALGNDFISTKSGGAWKIYDYEGRLINNESFDSFSSFNWRVDILSHKSGKIGLLSKYGKTIFEPIFDALDGFDIEGQSRVKIGSKYGVIDRKGNTILPIEYEYIYNDFVMDETDSKVVKVKKDGKEYFLNANYSEMDGSEDSALGDYDTIGIFEAGIARVVKNGKVGYVDADYQYIVKPLYDSAYQAMTAAGKLDYFTIHQGSKYGAIAMDGSVISPIYDSPPRIIEGIALCRIDNKYKYMALNDKALNDNLYQMAYDFSYDRALVQIDDTTYAFIDKSGQQVGKNFVSASSFGDGIAFVRDDEGTRYIDVDEKTIIGAELSIMYGFPFYKGHGIASVYDFEANKVLYGILKKDGTWLIEPIFDQVLSYGENVYEYYKNEKEALVDGAGQITWK